LKTNTRVKEVNTVAKLQIALHVCGTNVVRLFWSQKHEDFGDSTSKKHEDLDRKET
jgi:hypothetical protein